MLMHLIHKETVPSVEILLPVRLELRDTVAEPFGV
jgi:hypothetical protein